MTKEYQVDLETFRGPLDLLLYLVKRHEVDIFDIPIAKVAEQFLAYLHVIELIDVEWAGEFLVLAATLMEIKSKMLLPRSQEEEATAADPRQELVRQLLEYRKYKEAAALLEGRADDQQTRLARVPPEIASPVDPAQQPLHQVELWDLVSAFGRLMRETLALQPQQIILDDTPIHVHIEHILDRLLAQAQVSFTKLSTPPHTRGRLLGLFLAALELVKNKRVVATQEDIFGEIWLRLAEANPPPASSEEN